MKVYNKRASVNHNKKAMMLFKDNGIDVLIGFIMLNPLSDTETIRENHKFLSEHKSYRLYNGVSIK